MPVPLTIQICQKRSTRALDKLLLVAQEAGEFKTLTFSRSKSANQENPRHLIQVRRNSRYTTVGIILYAPATAQALIIRKSEICIKQPPRT